MNGPTEKEKEMLTAYQRGEFQLLSDVIAELREKIRKENHET